MYHPIGRHRRPTYSMAEQVWALTATLLASALLYVFTSGGRPVAAADRPVLLPAQEPRARAGLGREPETPGGGRIQVQASPWRDGEFPESAVWADSADRVSARWRSEFHGDTGPAVGDEPSLPLARPYLERKSSSAAGGMGMQRPGPSPGPPVAYAALV